MSLVSNKLPPGFRFHPTDEELIGHYLVRKFQNEHFPAKLKPLQDFIPEADAIQNDPWVLGDESEERYFYTSRVARYANGNRSKRNTGNGYWKATGKDKEIIAVTRWEATNINEPNRLRPVVVQGWKKTLVFYRGKPPMGNRTNWIMHEYRLAAEGNSPTNNNNKTVVDEEVNSACSTKDWVLCRIFQKKRGSNSTSNPRNVDHNQLEAEDTDNKEAFRSYKKLGIPTTHANDHEKSVVNGPVYYDFMNAKGQCKRKTRENGRGGGDSTGIDGGKKTKKSKLASDLNRSPCLSGSGSSGVTADVCSVEIVSCDNDDDEKDSSSSSESVADSTSLMKDS